MVLDPKELSDREKVILTGLFLAKFDSLGLAELGFQNFVEAFNVMGFALGAKPASIKNYRDEFDPLFEHRKGWHKRQRREYCMRVFEAYRLLDFETFSALVQSFFGDQRGTQDDNEKRSEEQRTSCATRLATGLAAERYFEANFPKLSDFSGYYLENTTLLGCGYDFRLSKAARSGSPFIAVEVKGMAAQKGSISLTQKEYATARSLGEGYYLFVVKNFADSPFHELYQNPTVGMLQFRKREQNIVQHSWTTSL